MMLTTDTVAIDLPATNGYPVRSCEWVPPMPGVPGHLVVRVRRSRGGREQADVYAVKDLAPGSPVRREFLLTRTTGPSVVAYVCVVGVPEPICTCRAGECRVEDCKHISSLSALVAEGAI
jgi:hypothetical protein